MNRMQSYLMRAGAELGIRVIAPFEVKLGSGKVVKAEAWLPDLGYPEGMIVSRSPDEFLPVAGELKRLGYGYSVFDEPLPNEEYDIEGYKEMFREWGWTAEPARMPQWMKSGK